ncbi:jg1034 [Pararge aegeria aegeria]|uniref:Jg1034 protein n=1 Tax=Pararge aegeria aegeria TaxID=348720 RepID=A0A8S4QP73_9NEOP|nr:jg1034 [Pararge aegeria aegeria]
MEMGGHIAQRKDRRWDSKVLEWQLDPQRGRQTTSSASQGAAGYQRLKTVEFGTPYKIPMSSSGRILVDMMMMMTSC